jgi:hypothetical protein
MVFSRHLLDGIRRGRIRCSIRVWTRPHVKAGGRYPLEEGQIVVESITLIDIADVTHDLARESGFDSVPHLLETARHGKGDNVYLIRFHYLRPGAWDEPPGGAAVAGNDEAHTRARSSSSSSRTLLQRIRSSPKSPKRRRAARG